MLSTRVANGGVTAFQNRKSRKTEVPLLFIFNRTLTILIRVILTLTILSLKS
jgi:hypothetical protein